MKVRRREVFTRFRLGQPLDMIAFELGCSVGRIRNLKTEWNRHIGQERIKNLVCPLDRYSLEEFFEAISRGATDHHLARTYRITLKQVTILKQTFPGLLLGYSRSRVLDKNNDQAHQMLVLPESQAGARHTLL